MFLSVSEALVGFCFHFKMFGKMLPAFYFFAFRFFVQILSQSLQKLQIIFHIGQWISYQLWKVSMNCFQSRVSNINDTKKLLLRVIYIPYPQCTKKFLKEDRCLNKVFCGPYLEFSISVLIASSDDKINYQLLL